MKIDFKNLTLKELGLSPERSILYNGSGGFELVNAIKCFNLPITKNDSIIDLGCGKGSAMYSLSRFRFNKVCGLDISPHLLSVAEDNFNKLCLTNYKLICMDAGNFTDWDEFNFIYMFNPFPLVVMKEVMQNINISLKRKPRQITIIYLFPTCHDELILNGMCKVNETIVFGLPLCIYKNSVIF